MSEYTDKIESLVYQFDYSELNEVDKNFVDEVLGSKEAYILLRKSILQAGVSAKSISGSKKMKGQLLNQFKEANSRNSPSPVFSLIGRRIPAYYSLVLMLLTALPFIFFLTQKPQTPDPQINYVSVAGPRDTVYVSLPADTIFTERVVYQKVFVANEPKQDVLLTEKAPVKPKDSFTASDINTSLSENSALNDLLISIE